MASPAIVAGVRSAAPRIIAFIRKNGFAAAIKKYGQSAVQKAVDAGEATVKGGRSAATKPRIKPKPQKKDSDATNIAGDKNKAGGNLTSSQKKKAALGAGIVAATPALISQVDNKKSSYTVKSGDTLSAIAKRMGVRLSEIKEANPQIKDLNKIRPV